MSDSISTQRSLNAETSRPIDQIDRKRLKTLIDNELALFAEKHPQSKKLFEEAKASLHQGVPMNWMNRLAGDFPIFVESAFGAHFKDVDGHDYLDLCLGDTGAMTGHAPPAAVEAITKRLQQGTTFMLPTADALFVGRELQRRFGLPFWQIAMTATDANRFSIRIARHITGRPKVLVFNWCYHGTVDETFAVLQEDGQVGPRSGNMGPPVNPSVTTKVVEFNDVEALEMALKDRDVACILAEPVMTNIGIVHPQPGYLQKMQDLAKKYGTLLIIDETHTICTGPGGYTKEHGLRPDMLTCGKPIASGIPAAIYGMTLDVAQAITSKTEVNQSDTSGIGGTLSGNALALAAMRVTLEQILTETAYQHTIALAKQFTDGVEAVIKEKKLPWTIQQLGCRAEYWFRESPPVNGAQAAAATDADLDHYMHLYALNRGILMTPFHNMALICPATTADDIDRHTAVFKEAVETLLSD
jgi:glutamate-1-semialdehyde 2,1-aminomutase